MKKDPLTILLIEDNTDHAELIRRGYEENQIVNKIYHVTDGEKALDYLFHRGEYCILEENPRPDIIFLDLRLPKIDGLEVLKKIKDTKELRDIHIIVLTSSSEEKDIAGAYEYHINDYLVKPIGVEKFSKILSEFGYE